MSGLELTFDPDQPALTALDVFARGQVLEFDMDLPPLIPKQWFDSQSPKAQIRLRGQAGDAGTITDLNPTWIDLDRTKIHFQVNDTSGFPIGPVEFDVIFQRTVNGMVKTYRSPLVQFTVVDGVSTGGAGESGGGAAGLPFTMAADSSAIAPSWGKIQTAQSAWVTVNDLGVLDLSALGPVQFSISGFTSANDGVVLAARIFNVTDGVPVGPVPQGIAVTGQAPSTVKTGTFTFPAGPKHYQFQIFRGNPPNSTTVGTLTLAQLVVPS